MMTGMRYRKTTGCIYSLNYHVVWCPKYRRPVLIGDIAQRLRSLLTEKAQQLQIEILALKIMPDHVHLFLSVPPTEAVQHFVNQLKGYTSRVLRDEFPTLRSRLPCLWSRAYYVGSTGNVSGDTIQRYIEAQKGI